MKYGFVATTDVDHNKLKNDTIKIYRNKLKDVEALTIKIIEGIEAVPVEHLLIII